ncbi:GspH/FimT family pseudopilin [Methylicorpusculum sp.]|uniref:GspH/FimT family pseudopilin n=1 Tax=Methylicorpusculum sp. TaxID=2713644 RepID=UPI002719C45A|nr:GspH/FimT family pseudopilin [Methylicorpusculum sp.]MDO8845063.1 GspH/FimT family pseudopilin [Methylicorpusculum sp.]
MRLLNKTDYLKNMRNKTKMSAGFTLLELMLVIGIAGVILTMGIPSFMDSVKSNRLTTRTNELVTAFNFARSESIKRGVRITVCKSTNGSSCLTSGSNWTEEWIVFTDQNNNAAYDSASETLLRVQANPASNITMNGTTNIANYVSYMPTGRSQLIAGGAQAGTIKVCDDRTGNVGINLTLNTVGRVNTNRSFACP